MTLTDCHPDIMEALLQFCYTGECRRPKRDMLGLLVMADRLDMPCLTAICEKVRPLALAAAAASGPCNRFPGSVRFSGRHAASKLICAAHAAAEASPLD